MRLDSHHHFWNYDPHQYPWIQSDWPIRRDFGPGELQPLLARAGLEGTIVVQARQSLEESRWLLALADGHEWIRGVVGWVDLRSQDVQVQLAEFAPHPKFVGVRHVVQDEPDDAFLLREEFTRGIAQLDGLGLVYELLIYPKQLPAALELVGMFPGQRFVLDHLAKPAIGDRALSPWRERILELGRLPNVWCKVSGMVTEARWNGWQPSDFKPFLEVAVEAFGWERLIYGSDWPVCLLSASYAQVYGLASDYVLQVAPKAEAAFFGETATRVYGLGTEGSNSLADTD